MCTFLYIHLLYSLVHFIYLLYCSFIQSFYSFIISYHLSWSILIVLFIYLLFIYLLIYFIYLPILLFYLFFNHSLTMLLLKFLINLLIFCYSFNYVFCQKKLRKRLAADVFGHIVWHSIANVSRLLFFSFFFTLFENTYIYFPSHFQDSVRQPSGNASLPGMWFPLQKQLPFSAPKWQHAGGMVCALALSEGEMRKEE